MYQPQSTEPSNYVSPTSKGPIVFSNKHKVTNFASFAGVNPAKSLHSPSTNTLISSLRGKGDESLKSSTDSKLQSFKQSFINPESQSEMFDPMSSVKSMKDRKITGEDQPRFEFKVRDRTSKRNDGIKMDNINNALELYMEKKQANNKNGLKDYSKPATQLHSTQGTNQQQTSASQQYGIQSTNKQLQFRKGPMSQRSDSNPKIKSSTKIPLQTIASSINKGPCLNDFVLGKKLGKGKFGQVYLVRHKRIGLICAMKVLSKQVIKQNGLQNQLSRQIMIQLYMNNPNIIQMYGMFTQNNNVYLLLEPCLDGHLLTQLKKKRRFEQDQAVNILREVLEGVEMLHRSSVIHRDLKPENICRHEGVSKISDFGWAVYSPDQFRQTFCGTPLYMSPQLLIGKQYTQSVDIWAIGMLAYELMVGRLPFKVQKSQQLSKIITDDIEFPEHIGISESAKDFVLTLLRKDPKERVDIDDLFSHAFLNKSNES